MVMQNSVQGRGERDFRCRFRFVAEGSFENGNEAIDDKSRAHDCKAGVCEEGRDVSKREVFERG